MTIDLKKTGLTSMIFLIMIALSLIIIQPVYEATVNKLMSIRATMIESLEQAAGLSVTYESMSPSILTGLRISRIQIKDTENSSVLAKISSVRFSYNVFNLLRGKTEDVLDSLVLVGVSAEFDQDKQQHIIEKITNLVSTLSNSSDFKGLPFSIRITTAALAYKNKDIRLKIQLRDTLVKNSTSGKNIQFTSNNSMTCDFLHENNSIGPLSAQFSLQGTVNPSLTESAVQLRIRELKNNTVSVKPVEAAFWYTDETINLQILENVGSFNFFAEYSLRSKDFDIVLEAQEFNPLGLVSIKKPAALISKAQDTAITGKYTVHGSMDNLTEFEFTADGTINLPPTIVPKGINVEVFAEGNLSNITMHTIRAEGPFCDIEYSGTLNVASLQPQGVLTVHSFILPNKNNIMTEMYLDPLPKGFLGFIPQLEIGDSSLTAIQLEIIPDNKTIDFSFLCYDYSHYEYAQNAEIALNGSVFFEGKPFVQSNIEVSNLFLDTVFGILAYVSPSTLSPSFADAKTRFSSFVASTEMYISSDFTAVTYNTPYTIIANTAKDQELAVLSFDGNETALQISQFDVLFSGQSLQASVSADFSPDYSDMFFSAQLAVNAIPYEIQGVLVDADKLVLSGSYGLASTIIFNSGSLIAGNLSFNSFPLSIKNYILSFSAQTAFEFSSLSLWNAEVVRFECLEASGSVPLAPSINLSGTFDSYGGMITNLTYSDTVSILNGSGNLMWNIIDSSFDSAQCYVSFAEPFSSESYEIDVSISNPYKKSLSNIDFFEDIFCSGLITIHNSPVSRFISQQTSDDTVTAQLNVLGTLSNPSVSVRVSNASVNLQGERLQIQSFVSLDDRVINLSETSVRFSSFNFTGIEAHLNLSSFTGRVTGEGRTFLGAFNEITSEFSLSIVPTTAVKTEEETKGLFSTAVPETFLATLSLPLINSTQYGQISDFSLSIIRSKGRFDVQGGTGKSLSFTNNPINGYLLDSGECLLILDDQLPVSFVAFGSIARGLFDIQVQDVLLDAERLKKIFDLGVFRINRGRASGSFHLGGLLTDPEFSGSVDVTDFSCEVPDYIEGEITASTAQLTGQGKYLSAEQVLGRTKDGNCFVDVAINFDKWQFESVVLNLVTPDDEKVKAFANLGLMEFAGDAQCNMNIVVKLTSVDINGSLYVDNAVGRIYPLALMGKKESQSGIDVTVNLDIMIGQRAKAFMYASILPTPIISALVNPMTPIKVRVNTFENDFALVGDLVLRGGEVNIGRSFYLREGRMVFDQNQLDFDPVITIRAEMRETDENGELIKIILSAENQKLSTFNYSLSSSPPRSEAEIMTILGQILSFETTGSVGGDIISAVGVGLNVFVQNTILKQIEDGLRDFLKVDILSFKTSVLQNTLRLYSEQNSGKVLTPGNFLDNSTVYIGKYFGDVLYGDFLLHLSYDDSKVDSNNLASGIAFEPELGFEMESPFATIRWSIAPDVGSLHNLWVPYTSISLSWKFMF